MQVRYKASERLNHIHLGHSQGVSRERLPVEDSIAQILTTKRLMSGQ